MLLVTALAAPSLAAVTVAADPAVAIEDTEPSGPPGSHLVLAMTCAGAVAPQLSWNEVKWYYHAPFVADATLLEAPGPRIGIGDHAGDGYTEFGLSSPLGGARVFPLASLVACTDLEGTESATVTDVLGEPVELRASMAPIVPFWTGSALSAEATWDPAHMPIGVEIFASLLVNVHPTGDEAFDIQLDHQGVRTLTTLDASNTSPTAVDGQTALVSFTLEEGNSELVVTNGEGNAFALTLVGDPDAVSLEGMPGPGGGDDGDDSDDAADGGGGCQASGSGATGSVLALGLAVLAVARARRRRRAPSA